MKTEYVRIYSEEELHHKVKRLEVMLHALGPLNDVVKGPDLSVLQDLWLQYETTRIVILQALDTTQRYPRILFVEREVDDDYDDTIKDSAELYNWWSYLTRRYLYLKHDLRVRFNIHEEQYEINRWLVLDFAAEVYQHLNLDDAEERHHMHEVLWWLNYAYLQDNESEYVPIEEVVLKVIAKKCETESTLKKLITTLDLVEE